MSSLSINKILAITLLVGTSIPAHASEYYMPPMPMMDPYQRPMHPMMQPPHQAPASQRPVDTGQNKAKEEYSISQSVGNQLKSMQDQQRKMQQHLQRIEGHLANIETLIRQLVENR
jgi:hypothetical protein